jgi:hypothetical protein
MAITRSLFRRVRSTRTRSRRARTTRGRSKRAQSKSKSYMKRRNKTFKRMKGGDNEDDMFPLAPYSPYKEQQDAGDELLDYVYKYVVYCYLTPNQNPEVEDIRNGILNVFLGDKTTKYNIKSADLIKKNSCPSWFSYSARKNCEIKKSWAYFLMCLILLDEIYKGMLLADEYNQKIIILDNKMSRSIVGIAPKVTDANYNLAKLLDPKGSNILNSIADIPKRKIIVDILKMITIRQEKISREDEKKENTRFKKLTPSKIRQKFPILKNIIQEESEDENNTGSETASETASDSST